MFVCFPFCSLWLTSSEFVATVAWQKVHLGDQNHIFALCSQWLATSLFVSTVPLHEGFHKPEQHLLTDDTAMDEGQGRHQSPGRNRSTALEKKLTSSCWFFCMLMFCNAASAYLRSTAT